MVENNDMPLVFTINPENYFRYFQHTGNHTKDREDQEKDVSQNTSEMT